MATATKNKVAKKSKKSSAAAAPPVSPQRIMEAIWLFAQPLMLEAAIRNRVFDVLDTGPKTLEQLVKATGASARGLRALVNALVGIQFLNRQGNKYSLPADVSTFLVTSKPTFSGGILLHMSDQLLANWSKLSKVVRTGKPAASVNQHGPGSKFFAQFVEDIFNMSYPAARGAAEALVSKATKPTSVLDLAAGSGVWGIAMAERSPKVNVTAVDWSGVIPITRKVATRHKVANRFKFVAGDLATAYFGRDHHVATLGHILHSEGEKRSRQLLKKVFASLAKGGTIVIAEFIVNDDRLGPPIPLIFAVNMLVNTDHGDTFSFEEIKGWLEAAGFRKVRQLPDAGPSPLVLADKP